MSQETNLNVAPYFDDFDPQKDYYKVLFKPGYPVQARELTSLQSILQNQVEKFGQHFFREGAKVIPGNTTYSTNYKCVLLENTYLGVPLSDYIDQLVGAQITGQDSGVTAIVDRYILESESTRNQVTLYLNYSGSGSNNQETVFRNGEPLTSNVTISTANTLIAEGVPFASTIQTDATAVGSAYFISNGIYFGKGTFLNVNDQTLILDQYSNTPNYRIGLLIEERIINPDLDPSLTDNSAGFNNFGSPGADRLQITTSLFKKDLTDLDDSNFVELGVVNNGILRQRTTSNTSQFTDVLAKRTYAESGDYYVKSFGLNVKESLNNFKGNRGIFSEDQVTYGGSTPSEDLALYQITPGRAFVKGYEVETTAPTYLDVLKPRTTKTLKGQQINYETGETLKLNRVHGSPTIGIGNTYVLSLRDSRVGDSATGIAGKEIGLARVYDFSLDSGTYNASNSNINEWGLSLYDVQTTTEITVNENITLSVPTFIKGKNSGATGFLKEAATDTKSLVLYETSGKFILNENFIIDGVENSRVATAVTSYGISDVLSVFGSANGAEVGAARTFSADVVLTPNFNVGVATITAAANDFTSVIRSTNPRFPGQIKAGNIISFSGDLSQDPVFASVVSVATSSVTVTGVSTVDGVASGAIPTSASSLNDVKVIAGDLGVSNDRTLYTELSKSNISDVQLNDASLVIRKTQQVNIVDNKLSSAILTESNESFLPFTPERYLLIRSDGTTEELTSDKVQINAGSNQLEIFNLGSDDEATLVTTITKVKPKAKNKIKNRVNSIVIDKSVNSASGIGSTTLNDGLTYGNYPYGTRVQDENISLNHADLIEVHGVFELATDPSVNNTNPSAPSVVLSNLTGPTGKTSDLVIGEEIVGETSNARAIVAVKETDSKIVYLSKNQINFKEGEVVDFEESGVRAVVITLDTPSKDISFKYSFTNGQNGEFYNYGVLNRKNDEEAPQRKLIAYFSNGYYESTDDGDITTVNSYSGFDYATEIQDVNGVRNSDIIDIRPKVSDIETVSEGDRSPLEFNGRSFNVSGNSATNILASNEGILTDFSFYLGRIDRVYLTKDGVFQVKYGTPAENPEKPTSVDDALEIATITLPPFLYNITDASKRFLEHKRYRMVDIKQLENRIKNLEFFTSLSLLETNTANLFVPDANGLNRFKSGFFVDNFTSFLAQEESVDLKNSVDFNQKEARPKHYTTQTDLTQSLTGSGDLRFTNPDGTNIRKTNDIVTLDYTDEVWLSQQFCTRSESVTPFIVGFWVGALELLPASDSWTDQVRLEANIVQAEGNFSETLERASRTLNVDPQTGFAPAIWNSWVNNWTGQEEGVRTEDRTLNERNVFERGNTRFDVRTSTTFRDTIRQVFDTGVATRTGTRTVVTEQFDNESLGDRVVSRDLISFARSRNIEFNVSSLKPNTQVFGFFDGVAITDYCIPKLLEINMISGTFQVGETITGTMRPVGNAPATDSDPQITFRVAQANHKSGAFDSATEVFTINPYNNTQVLPSAYSSTSTILNIDTFSLCDQPQGDFIGYVAPEMVLVGGTSGAQATISQVRLVSDFTSSLIGSLFIPDPNIGNNPRFEVGTKVLTFIDDANNNIRSATTRATSTFLISGVIETVQENIVSIRNANVQSQEISDERDIRRQNETVGTQVLSTEVIAEQTRTFTENINRGGGDPLAQTFVVEDTTGIFITKCDVFFEQVDNLGIPVIWELRTVENGVPTTKILPLSQVILPADQINVSDDGSVATTFTLKAPVYLEPGVEYAMVMRSASARYRVFISRVGENDLITQTFVSNQPYLGSLYKSQNGSVWEPSQWEDLKFTLYRANFVENGSIEVYSPQLSSGNNQIAKLVPNSINLVSRSVRIGIGSTLQDTDLTLGNTIVQHGSNASGNFVGKAGIATGTLNIINSGIGFTPSSGYLEYTGVELINITSNGRNAKADITIDNGVAVGATISEYVAASGGQGYVIGDVLGVSTIGNNNLGRNLRLSLVSIANTNELLLDNVQGDFITGAGNTVQFINNSGLRTDLNAAQGGNVLIDGINDIVSDGIHFSVNHRNHGMYFADNRVAISDVESDILPIKLTAAIDSSSTSPITVDSTTGFDTFENVGVGTTNLGYLKIGNEIVSYEAASGNSITIVERGIDSTSAENYSAGTQVFKYELGNVSLRRINKTHNLNDVTAASPRTFDSYKVKLNMGESGIGRSTGESFPILYMGETKSTGGSKIKATQNIPFEILTPQIQHMTVQGTNIDAQVRTISGSSISGNEIPYIDQGFEEISVSSPNYFSTPRIIASKVNEDAKLSTLPGNKSMTLRLNFGTTDSRVSPVIDTQRMSVVTTSNRVDNVITNYITDSRVNGIETDPTGFQYLSKEISLENPATSLKIIVEVFKDRDADIRGFFAIADHQNFNPIYEAFPGFNNINERGQIIDVANNDGSSDTFVAPAEDFREHTFTIDELPSFNSYRIKLLLTSTNQANPPRIRNLRVIALA
tara:strand:+ start:18171 stop:25631 length:7461 start_codon:yes stop_codon:yes gene_type:complete